MPKGRGFKFLRLVYSSARRDTNFSFFALSKDRVKRQFGIKVSSPASPAFFVKSALFFGDQLNS